MMMKQMSLFSSCFLLGIGFIISMLLCMAHAKIHYYDFVLEEKNFTRLCSTKSMLVVNGSFPGPVIQVQKGDTAYVNVHNQGNYGLTIHWHGVKQPGNSWSDGPEYITQCPIEPGSNFTYEVLFTKEEGTLWWHAHSDWTRASVHGAIVIHPADGTSYPYPTPNADQVFVLGSWYTYDVNKVIAEDLLTGADTPRSDAYVINGQPGDLVSCSNDSTYRWEVDYGKTYLVRVINAAMNVDLFFAIGGHNFTVVGMDGNYLKPIITDYMVISPGQTMDLLLTTNQSLSYYYIATRQYDSVKPSVRDFDNSTATAILVYRGNYTAPEYPVFPTNLPVFKDFMSADNFVREFRSLASEEHPVDVPMNISTRMFIVISMNQIHCPNSSCEGIDGNRLASSMNNLSFVNPTTDVLLAYYKNTSGFYTADFLDEPTSYYNFTSDDLTYDISFPIQGTKVKMLDYNSTVEITFQGTEMLDASETHPMHMHGYSFYVVGFGYGNFNPQKDPLSYNLVDPPELNTVTVPKNGWATIRFKASNPGVWFWHCHFDRHLSWGMDTVMIVKNGGTPETSLRPPPSYLPPCNATLTKRLFKFDDSDENIERFNMI